MSKRKPTDPSRALLAGQGVDADALAGRLVCLDAHETLARFMVDGLPDE